MISKTVIDQSQVGVNVEHLSGEVASKQLVGVASIVDCVRFGVVVLAYQDKLLG